MNIDLKNLRKISCEEMLTEKENNGLAFQVKKKISQASDRIFATTEQLKVIFKNI